MSCALVTGGSRGIGRAVCLALAKDHGLHILINYAGNHTAAEETQKAIEEQGGSAETLQFDVTDAQAVKNSLEHWSSTNPERHISVLVNNAGITRDKLLVFMEDEEWDAVLDTSLKGTYNVTRAAIQSMVRKRGGRVVNMVSVSGLKGVAGQTNYSAAKGGMIAFTRSLAQELAKRKITVNAVAPGFIRSDMTSDLNEEELKPLIPAGRFGEAEEVAHLVSFLVSEQSAYITGQVVGINGGIV